jgi:hypothetical protein
MYQVEGYEAAEAIRRNLSDNVLIKNTEGFCLIEDMISIAKSL